MEPDKCASWEWVRWDEVETFYDEQNNAEKAGRGEAFEGRRLFLPISNLFRQRPGFHPTRYYYYGFDKLD